MKNRIHLYINTKSADKFDETCEKLKAANKSQCLDLLVNIANITDFYKQQAVNAILTLINLTDDDDKKQQLAKLLKQFNDIFPD